MSTHVRNKLNQLLASWLPGTLKTAKKLVAQGYSHRLLKVYVDSGWIESAGVGAYSRKNDRIEWVGGLYAIQQDLAMPIYVGGLSALSIHGLSQYVAMNERLTLYNSSGKKLKLPKWFGLHFPEFEYHQYYLFSNNALGLTKETIYKIEFILSKPERALLECLALVPHDFNYQHASELIDNARLVDSVVMQSLLENCRSIKVKRLFLYLAEKHQLPCFKKLNINVIDLGEGKRKIADGGTYIKKYQISVPTTEDNIEVDV